MPTTIPKGKKKKKKKRKFKFQNISHEKRNQQNGVKIIQALNTTGSKSVIANTMPSIHAILDQHLEEIMQF